jgi:hypothetical protein
VGANNFAQIAIGIDPTGIARSRPSEDAEFGVVITRGGF